MTKYGCDLQELSGVISGEPEDWSRQGRLSQAIIADNITVSGAEWSVRFSLLNLKIYAYCLHFGPTASNPEDVKIEGVHEKSVEYDGRKYSLINKYGSTTQPEYWGCVGLRIENIATAATVTATSANLEATDSAVYFVLSGTYQNIDADKIEDLLKTVYFDFQERDGSWTVYTFDRTVSVEGNNWTIKFDITKLPVNANAFTGHFLPALENNTANAGENLTLTTEQLPDGTITATVGAKKYTLVNKHGSGEATDNWGCVSVKVEDAVVVTDKYVISKDTIEKAELVQEDGKAYFVVTTNAGTASNGYTLEELATTKVGNIDGSTHVLYDCTSAKIVDGKLVLKFELTQSAKQNELYMNLYKSDEQKITDINEAVTVSSIAVNGKAFSIKNTQEYNSILLTVAPDFTIDYTKIQVTEEGGKPVLKIEGTVGTSITDATYMGFDLQSTTGSWPRVQDLDYTIAVAQGKFTVTVQLSSLDFLGGDGYIMHMYAGGKAEGTGVITIDVEDKESKLTSTDVTIDCVRYVVNRHTMWNTRPMVTLTVENVHTIQNGVCVICGKVCNHEGQTGTTCSKCGATLVSGSDYTKDENVVEFGTWVDIPVELTKGNQVIMYGTQTTTMTDTVAEKEGAANPTFGQPVNHGTVIWECKEGYTGRFDNYGWQFNVTNFTGTMTGITLAVFDAQGNFATGDVWTLYQDICKDSRWVVRIAYASDYVLSVYIAVTANSGEHAGYTYVDAYDVHIAAAQAKYTFHVTGGSTGGLTKFAVTGHQTAAFTGRTDTYASLPTWPTFVRSTDLVKGGSVTLEATLDSFGADDKGTQNWLTAVARLNVVNAENAFFFRADGIGHFPWLEDGSSWHGANIDNQSITISNAAYIVSSKPSGDLSYETFVGGIVTMTFSLDVNGTLSFSYTLTKGETTYSYSGTISTLTAPSYGLDFAVDGGTLSNITITTTYAQA